MNKNIDNLFISKHTSFQEQTIYYFCKYYLKEKGVFNRYKFKSNKRWFEADVFIASKKIAIEYDGIYWHNNRDNSDNLKRKEMENWGIRVIVIKESTKNIIDGDTIFYNCYKNTYENLSWVLSKLASLIGHDKVLFNISEYVVNIKNMFLKEQYENSFYIKFPKASKEWDYEKNGDLKPWEISPFSSKKVHWKCKKGHEWVAPVYTRSRGSGCFACHVQKKYDRYKSELPGKFWLKF